MKYLFVALALVTLLGLSACETLDVARDKAYGVVDKQLEEYCTRMGEAERAQLRDRVNSKLDAADIEIHCPVGA